MSKSFQVTRGGNSRLEIAIHVKTTIPSLPTTTIHDSRYVIDLENNHDLRFTIGVTDSDSRFTIGVTIYDSRFINLFYNDSRFTID